MEEDNPKYLTLNSGYKIPQFGLGTFLSKDNLLETVTKAIVEEGYRHIDTAKIYGNEEIIGEAIQAAIKTGKVKREDLFITTKLWNADKAPGNVLSEMKTSLDKLKLDYVDLYLIHWIMGNADPDKGTAIYTPMHVTWPEMENLVHLGLTKSIGVSNFNVQILLDLLSYCKIKPAVNQVELHPYLPQADLVNFCMSKEIMIEAYAPMGAPGNTLNKISDRVLMEEEKIKELSMKYGKTWAQIVLNWGLNRGYVVLAKTVNLSRLKENWDSQGFKMDKEDYEAIDKLDVVDIRFYDPKLWPGQLYAPLFA